METCAFWEWRAGSSILIFGICWRVVAILTLVGSFAYMTSQTTSGTITGTVMDSSGLPVPGAKVSLASQMSGATRKAVTESTGVFVFSSIPPGTFALEVAATGFRPYRKEAITLNALETLSIGLITLGVGSPTGEAVTVTAEAAIQTASQERSAVLDSNQLAGLMARGRDYMHLLEVLPGVGSNGPGNDFLYLTSSPTIQGIRSEYNTISYDGVTSNTSAAGFSNVPLNLDAIQEVTVLLGNYQAEYGRNSGAVISLVTKSGTRQFHGSWYYYVRNEALNANNFFNNQQGAPRPQYRYNTIGYNLGGPIYWPGKFNSSKNKLFFFFSQELLPTTLPGGTRAYTVPTALERSGNFSQSVDLGGNLILVKDPTTGQPFPDNIVPLTRVDPNMQKLLSIFPLPNFTKIAISQRNYNYLISDATTLADRQELLRLDYNISDKLRAYFRGMNWYGDFAGVNVPANNNTWLNVPAHYKNTDPQLASGVTFIASPTLVNEFTIGYSPYTETTFLSSPMDLARLQKSALGINIGQYYPGNNPLDLVPAASFGVPNSADIAFDPRTFLNDHGNGWTVADGVTKGWRKHSFKVGVYVEKVFTIQEHHTGGPAASGSFSFAKDVNNPLDANYAYANALLGNFDSYTEATNVVNYAPYQTVLEWYAQDSWKISKRLTLEYGARFTHAPPYEWKNNEASNLALQRYNPANAPTLYFPALNSQGQRVAVNPATGLYYSAVYVGLIVPGSGNIANGAVLASDPTYPRGFQNLPAMAVAPRVGFAYDVFGDGKTALRGGFGIFNNSRPRAGQAGDMSFNPPTIFTPSTYYGNVGTFLNSQGLLSPTSWTRVIEENSHYVQSYNMHFGIQRKIGSATVVEVAYSGTLGRHLGETHDINEVPYGAEFLPQNQDHTTGTPLPDNFFRPYPGYGSIPYMAFDTNSSYHSLQTQVTRRFSRGLQFGAAWTWSKAMDYTDSYNGTLATYVPWRAWNYGKAGFDQTHVFVVNWLWDLPKVSHIWNNAISRNVFDNWQLSGIATFASGFPQGVTFNTTDGANITGGGDGARVVVMGDATLSKSQQTLEEFFNTAVFARPAEGTIGNAPKDVFRGPGINNWDLTLVKNFPIRDRARGQLRWEAYNAFNHTQWSGVNTVATFNPRGQQVNSLFGQVTSARDPRIMQLAVRVSF